MWTVAAYWQTHRVDLKIGVHRRWVHVHSMEPGELSQSLCHDDSAVYNGVEMIWILEGLVSPPFWSSKCARARSWLQPADASFYVVWNLTTWRVFLYSSCRNSAHNVAEVALSSRTCVDNMRHCKLCAEFCCCYKLFLYVCYCCCIRRWLHGSLHWPITIVTHLKQWHIWPVDPWSSTHIL